MMLKAYFEVLNQPDLEEQMSEDYFEKTDLLPEEEKWMDIIYFSLEDIMKVVMSTTWEALDQVPRS